MNRRTWLVLAGGVCCVAVAACARAGKFYEGPSIGDAAPDFANLVGTDDKQHSLGEYASAKAVVVIFTCNHCPVAIANEDRIIALQKDYADKGVQVVAINVNNLPEDTLEPMKVRAAEKKFNFPYLYDSSQKSARAFGAAVTPHVYLLDGQRKIAYMGAIDDSAVEPEKVSKQYLRDALDAVLAGTAPMRPETKAAGCGIKYE